MKALYRFALLVIVTISVFGNPAFLSAREMTVFTSPNGGFDPLNNQRTVTFPDGTIATATLTNQALNMIRNTPNGGEIKIAMYSFSVEEVQRELIKVAGERDIRVKVLLDNSAEWTQENVDLFMHRVKMAGERYKKFDYQIKLVTKESFIKAKRTRKLSDGTMIYGTMHEKMLIFYDRKDGPPRHAANGSANLCDMTDKVYAEDRVVFFDDPEVSKAFAQEFARLWEEFGIPAYGTITPEKLDNSRVNSDVRIVFTSLKNRPRAMTVDRLIAKTLDQVDARHGTIDIALFAYTHYGMTQKLLEMAEALPKVKIRILLDHSQLRAEGDKKGLMSEYLEKEIRARRIKNIEIRYKFRANAYGFDKETEQNMLVHVRSFLMHHKCLWVNRRYLVTGSYNWSESASDRNLENVMKFDARKPAHKEVVERFLAEFEAIWNSSMTVDAWRGKKLAERIVKALEEKDTSFVRGTIERQPGQTVEQLMTRLKKSRRAIVTELGKLVASGLVKLSRSETGLSFSLTD